MEKIIRNDKYVSKCVDLAKSAQALLELNKPMIVKTMEINDAIHGYIPVPEYVRRVLDTALMQRLKTVRQCGTVYQVFMSANHTRFTHSIGCMHLAREYVSILGDESDPVYMAFVLACLLHDVGHGPMSHVFERAIRNSPLHDKFIDHDEWRKVLLFENVELYAAVGGECMATIICAIWDETEALFNCGYPDLHTLLSGDAGVDRLDYLPRDTMYTNPIQSFRATCVQRIMHNTTIDSTTNRIVYNEKACDTIQSLLDVRWFLFNNVYTHKTVHAADTLILRLFKDSKVLETMAQYIDADQFVKFTDDVILSHPAMTDYARRRLPKVIKSYKMDHRVDEFDKDIDCYMLKIHYDDTPTSKVSYIYRWFEFE